MWGRRCRWISLFCLQHHLGGLFASSLSSKCVPRPAGGSSVWLGKLLAWKCKCNKQVDCGPVSTNTEMPLPHSARKSCVWNFAYKLFLLYSTKYVVSPLQEGLSYEYVDSHMYFFFVHYLEGKYMGNQCSKWSCKIIHSFRVPPTGAWMDIANWSLEYWPDSSWLGTQHFVGVIWFGTLE